MHSRSAAAPDARRGDEEYLNGIARSRNAADGAAPPERRDRVNARQAPSAARASPARASLARRVPPPPLGGGRGPPCWGAGGRRRKRRPPPMPFRLRPHYSSCIGSGWTGGAAGGGPGPAGGRAPGGGGG